MTRDDLAFLDCPLEAEMRAYPWSLAALRRLMRDGVPPVTVGALRAGFDIAAGQVSIGRAGETFDPGGPDARLLLAVRDPWGVLEDIAAVSTSSPDEWALRAGVGAVLGSGPLEDANERASVMGWARLRLFPTPIAWLRGGCAGTCVLDWGRALPLLRSLGENVTLVADPPLDAKVKRLLARSGLPLVGREAPAEPASLAERIGAMSARGLKDFHVGRGEAA